MRFRKIKFNDNDYILLGENHGSITTEERFKTGTVSFAHLFCDGNIRQYGKIIGTKKDIEFLEEIEDIKQNDDAFYNLLFGNSWR